MRCLRIPERSAKHLSILADIVPAGPRFDLMREMRSRALPQKSDGNLAMRLFAGTWHRALGCQCRNEVIFDALNIIYGEAEKRGFVCGSM
jgi:hypothetical protein